MTGPIREVDRSFDGQVTQAVKIINRNLDMVAIEPMARLTALMRLTCLMLVTELAHLPPRIVRQQAFKLFRMNLMMHQDLMEKAQNLTEASNDEAS